MTDYRMDDHKLLFHPRRVAQWLDGAVVYPIYLEISPSGACNHRCRFCAQDYLGYRPAFLDAGRLGEVLEEMGRLGVKSVMYAGEGEPLLHREFASIVDRSRSAGIDVAVTSNGVLFEPALAERVLGNLSWFRASVNAGTAATYARVHGTRPEDFEKVLGNLAAAVRLRDIAGWRCAVGAQAVLLPDNAGEIETLALRLRDMGVDYLAVKPYAHHPLSRTQVYAGYDHADPQDLAERLQGLGDGRFQVIYRERAMQKAAAADRGYDHCLALPFWAYLDSQGRLWACKMSAGDPAHYLGSIYEQGFQSIWEGSRRAESLAELQRRGVSGCVKGCRMDEVNRYLWALARPSPHVNFI